MLKHVSVFYPIFALQIYVREANGMVNAQHFVKKSDELIPYNRYVSLCLKLRSISHKESYLSY